MVVYVYTKKGRMPKNKGPWKLDIFFVLVDIKAPISSFRSLLDPILDSYLFSHIQTKFLQNESVIFLIINENSLNLLSWNLFVPS